MLFADRLRQRGECYPAAAQYRKVVEIRPDYMAARAGLITCLLEIGFYREAMYHARMGISFGWKTEVFRERLVTADSALRVSAPRGTVHPPARDSILGDYLTVGKRKR
jgi:hypothetical protein